MDVAGKKLASVAGLLFLVATPACAPNLSGPAIIEKAGERPDTAEGEGRYVPLDLGHLPHAVPSVIGKGRVLAGGVPFILAGGGMDLARSMSGLQEPFRVKHVYHNPRPEGEKHRLAAKVPAGAYAALHLLAYVRGAAGSVDRMTVRAGIGGFAALYEDVDVEVPRGGEGEVFHVKVPLHRTGNLEGLGREFVLEFARDVNVHVTLPDPYEFTLVPAGRPSGVVVLAATLERSPLEVGWNSVEAGNLVHEGQAPLYRARLTNRLGRAVDGVIIARCAGPGTPDEDAGREEWTVREEFRVGPGAEREVALDLAPPSGRRGWYAAALEVVAGGRTVQSRGTTFAILAPDTRRAVRESPFGVWCFFRAHNVMNPPDLEDRLGSIMKKGGWRYTFGHAPWTHDKSRPKEENDAEAVTFYRNFTERYGVRFTLQSAPHSYQRIPGWFDEVKFHNEVEPWLAAARRRGYDPWYKVLHESRSSSALLLRFSEYLGGDFYDMPDEERGKIDGQFGKVVKYTRAIRKADPGAKIVLINDYPAVGIEYMKRNFPKDAFDAFGSEGANFMREPERQPDWLSLLGHMQQWKRAMREYGYGDKPLWMTEAFYHSTNPGNLSLHRQAVIYVREAMLALANGVERLAGTGTLKDSSDDYRWSNWGSSGFLFRAPEFNPKPSFAMYAWMTQVLDGKGYAGRLDTGSTSLHLLDFAGEKGSHVYPLWVVRGRQEVILAVEGEGAIVYGPYGNELETGRKGDRLTLAVSDAPVYVTGTKVRGVLSRSPVEIPGDAGEVILEFTHAGAMREVGTPSKVLEGNWDYPRLKGRFESSIETVDGQDALKVRLLEDDDPRTLLYRYVEYALSEPVELQGRPWKITVRVKGNGGWGRLMLEVKDAAGRTWTSCGNQHRSAVNSSDNKGDSYVSFDGWQTMTIALPGQYPGRDQFVAWPGNYDWWPTNTPECMEGDELYDEKQCELGIARVDHPLRLAKVIVAMQPRILYVDGEVPVRNREIAIHRIGVIQAPEGI